MKGTLFLGGLGLVATTIAHVDYEQGNSLEPRAVRWEPSKHGKYEFLGCNQKRQAMLGRVLDSLHTALGPIIQDSRTSIRKPSRAFETFFGDRTVAPFVTRILTSVITWEAKRPPIRGYTSGSPTFLCVDPAQPQNSFEMQTPDGSKDLIDHCRGPPVGPACSYLIPHPFIILCPGFFNFPEGPNEGKVDCPVVDRTRTRFQKNGREGSDHVGSSVYANAQWLLLEEIVHYYLTAQNVIPDNQPEIYNINDARALSPRKSAGNGVSYAYYAGIGDDRELLEADLNQQDQPDTASDGQSLAGGVLNVTSIQFSGGETLTAGGPK
ncbi:MAG: hypothetical protein LQ344_004776 [Seirophora lacunosa]|nr:MAG: hypothetical protein LQ344_004776 [Seirophora lacunosa]